MCVQDSDLPADQDLLKTTPTLHHNHPHNTTTTNNNNNNNNISNSTINNNNNISSSSNNNSNNISNNSEAWSDLQSQIDSLSTQMQNSSSPNSNPLPLESISEDTAVAVDEERNGAPVTTPEFLPNIRSGDWSDIGGRDYMEDTHVCISDLARSFGSHVVTHEAVSFYGVFDGHGGKAASQFVRDHLPRVIVEDADFPLNLEKAVTRSFVKTDDAFAESCSVGASQTSGTTALTAMIFGRSLLVANAGDCRAVLSRRGAARALSKDHRPCSRAERARVESMGGFVEYGYLNGQLGVTRALGDWHLEGMKHHHDHGPGPLSAEPELELVTLTREDEFLIIASDGVWDVFSNQNAVDFARRRLQLHNDVKMCCKEIVEEAVNRGATDNLTVVMVCFHAGPPPAIVVPQRMRVRRSISAEGLQSIKLHL